VLLPPSPAQIYRSIVPPSPAPEDRRYYELMSERPDFTTADASPPQRTTGDARAVPGPIFGNVPKVSAYLSMPTDTTGKPLDGSKAAYTLTFAKGKLPPVKYFWSITMYDLPDRYLVENPIKRYSIGSSSPGLKTNEDGSLVIYRVGEVSRQSVSLVMPMRSRGGKGSSAQPEPSRRQRPEDPPSSPPTGRRGRPPGNPRPPEERPPLHPT
jgi:hypothetical protein